MRGVQIDRAMLWRWVLKLGAWCVFVLLLAAARQDLHPAWDEIAWLVGPAVGFVGICIVASYGLAHLKLWLKVGALRHVDLPEARFPPRQGPAALDFGNKASPKSAIGSELGSRQESA